MRLSSPVPPTVASRSPSVKQDLTPLRGAFSKLTVTTPRLGSAVPIVKGMDRYHLVERGPARGTWEPCAGHCAARRPHMTRDELEAVRLWLQDRARGRYVSLASVQLVDVERAQAEPGYRQLVLEAELLRHAEPTPAAAEGVLRGLTRRLGAKRVNSLFPPADR